MNLINFLSYLTVLFDIILINFYFGIFFDKQYSQKKICIPLFLIGTILYYCSILYLPTFYLRFIAYLSICFLFTFCVKGNLFKKLILVFIYAIIGGITETLVNSFLMIFYNSINILNADKEQIFITGVFLSNAIILLIIIALIIIWHKFFRKNNHEQLTTKKYFLFILFIIFIILLYLGIHYLALTSSAINSAYVLLCLTLILILLLILVFFMLHQMEYLQFIKTQNLLATQHLLAQENFYEESIQKNQVLKKQLHDEKNLLLGIKSYLATNDINVAMSSIDSKLDNLQQNIYDYTGNIALDTVLSSKISKATKYSITIRPAVAIYQSLIINIMDLVLLLGNALDNAIEACQHINNVQRIIYLEIKIMDNYLYITITNPVEESVKIINGTQIATTKSNKDLHGLGIKNINDIVNKYNGTMQLSCEDKQFILQIILQNN